MQDIKPIRVFLEVLAQRSFAGAARKLQMTPASVTRIVAKLEEDLGHQLLLRTTRQVSLTSIGALVAAKYQPLVDDLDRLTEEITRRTQPDRGRLSISAPMSFGLRLLPGLIESFRLAYPNIALKVHLDDTLVDFSRDNCDLAIRISTPPRDKSSIWRKLCEVPMIPVASPKLLDRIRRPETPMQLERTQCMTYAVNEGPEIWHFRKGPIKRDIQAGTGVVTNNGDLLYGLVAAGCGIALLPEFIVRPGIESGHVVTLLEDWETPSLWLMLYYPPYEVLPPLVATFTDFFEAYLREVKGLDFSV